MSHSPRFWDTFRELSRGRRCHILGNLEGVPFDPVALGNEITFACDKAIDRFRESGTFPTFHIFTGESHASGKPTRVGITVLSESWRSALGGVSEVSVDVVSASSLYPEFPHFSKNPHSFLWEGGLPAYFALQIAHFLEFQDIRLWDATRGPTAQLGFRKARKAFSMSGQSFAGEFSGRKFDFQFVPVSKEEKDGANLPVTAPWKQDLARISVIVCASGKLPGNLENCLTSLLGQDYPKENYEVILVDAGSDERTKMISQSHSELVYVKDSAANMPQARNRGIEIAQGEVVAFVDESAEVSRTWIQGIAKTFAISASIDAVACRVLPSWTKEKPHWFAPEHLACLNLLDLGNEPKTIKPGSPPIPLNNSAFRKTALAKFGRFETELKDPGQFFHRGEGQRLQRAIHKSGRSIYYNPGLAVFLPVDERNLKPNFIMNAILYGFFLDELQTLEGGGQEEEAQTILGMFLKMLRETELDPSDKVWRLLFDDLLETAIFLRRVANEEKYVTLSRYEEKKGDFRRAIQMLDQLLAQSQSHPSAFLLAVDLLLKHGFQPRASEIFAIAQRIFRNDVDVLTRSALHYLGKGDYGNAEPFLAKARQLDPKDDEIATKLAALYSATGRSDKAIALLKEVLAKNPDHLPALLLIAKDQLKLGALDDFLESHQKLERWLPDHFAVEGLWDEFKRMRQLSSLSAGVQA